VVKSGSGSNVFKEFLGEEFCGTYTGWLAPGAGTGTAAFSASLFGSCPRASTIPAIALRFRLDNPISTRLQFN